MNIILLCFAVMVALWYLLLVSFSFGICSSISATYNYFSGGRKVYYTLFIWGIAIPLMIVSNTALGWWAGAVLAIDGAAPATSKDKLQEFLHIFGAGGGIILGMLTLWMNFNLWYLVIIFGLFTAFSKWLRYKNHIWWIEVAALVIMITGLFIKTLR